LSSRWEYGHLARRARQWPTREGLIERVAASPLLDGFPRRPAITRPELDAHLMELHPVEQTYDDFKAAARAALNTA
jgi:hypothetical protein